MTEPAPTAEPAAASPDDTAPSAEAATPGNGVPSGGAADRHSMSTDITAGPGGVMTNEVGVITGDLTLRTDYADGKVTVHVQYKEADEWYVATGGRAKLHDPADLEAVHSIVVGLLHRPEG